ncbi:hypothetical protein NC652_030352 [Populus alba x Populus x berolinensis]|nr:hypothetical protein NC652_030352 [Populus alba x Populus x berolinensis]
MVQRLTYRKRHSNLTSTALSKPLVGNWYIKPPATWLVDPNVQLLERGFKGLELVSFVYDDIVLCQSDENQL